MTTYQDWLIERQDNSDRPDMYRSGITQDDIINMYLATSPSSCATGVGEIPLSASSVGPLLPCYRYRYHCDSCNTYNWYDITRDSMKCKNCGANIAI